MKTLVMGGKSGLKYPINFVVFSIGIVEYFYLLALKFTFLFIVYQLVVHLDNRIENYINHYYLVR